MCRSSQFAFLCFEEKKASRDKNKKKKREATKEASVALSPVPRWAMKRTILKKKKTVREDRTYRPLFSSESRNDKAGASERARQREERQAEGLLAFDQRGDTGGRRFEEMSKMRRKKELDLKGVLFLALLSSLSLSLSSLSYTPRRQRDKDR